MIILAATQSIINFWMCFFVGSRETAWVVAPYQFHIQASDFSWCNLEPRSDLPVQVTLQVSKSGDGLSLKLKYCYFRGHAAVVFFCLEYSLFFIKYVHWHQKYLWKSMSKCNIELAKILTRPYNTTPTLFLLFSFLSTFF